MTKVNFPRVGILPNPRYEYFAQRVAAGAPREQAYLAAGYRAKDTRQSAYRLQNRAEVRKRIIELREEVAELLKDCTLGSVKERVRELEELWRRLKALIHARAADPTMAVCPGGETGLLVRRRKVLGNGTGTIDEFCLDTGLLSEMRALEAQAARELGQWTQKLEV